MIDTATKTETARPGGPPRAGIAAHYLAGEAELVVSLIEKARLSAPVRNEVEAIARRLAETARAGRRKFGGVDAFMNEYGLTSEEGVILMCLAEALLRIPDSETADRLIADKIGGGNWERHLGHSESLLVNASTWGLMLTGRMIDLAADRSADVAGTLKRIIGRSGEPIVREALRHAMRVLGQQFVQGRTIGEALANAASYQERGYRFSFDMLGEAARTARDAERYFRRYMDAVEAVGKAAGKPKRRDDASLFARPGLSVKLSALHPRYEAAQGARVRRELGERLFEIAALARTHWLTVTVDAEEQDRLDLNLSLLAGALGRDALAGWNGLGLAVQAYGKRALPVLEWLGELAKGAGRRIPVRLVKGAYWDAEIKFAQEQGLAAYPVFTRKTNTDVSYLACMKFLAGHPKLFFPQFATHNAHTIAAAAVLAGDSDYEFQRLHGMGEGLYEEVIRKDRMARPARIYAPVGSHEELLPYLVRRLLENGSNTSFVHRLADDEAPVEEIIADPVERMAGATSKSHPKIPLPEALYAPERVNSQGLALWEDHVREPLIDQMRSRLAVPVEAGPVVGGEARLKGRSVPVLSPHDARETVGTWVAAGKKDIEDALTRAQAAAHGWDALGGAARAKVLEHAANLLEADRAGLMALMVREAGKTLPNALSEVREATDFLRYYAAQARAHFTDASALPGPTGECNVLALRGRGVFACISPWNFPLAIFTGQIAAALAAGNAVMAKPAEQTPLTAVLTVRLLHQAGVPGDVLALLPGPGETVGSALTGDARVAGVAFTGSIETAAAIHKTLAARKGAIAPLIAETGGVNAMIVDSTALPEQVVRDAVRSAFDSAGQRCSALRVLFLQEDAAERTLDMLLGAMEELAIGDPFDYATDVGPVIDKDARETLNAHKAAMRKSARELIDLPLPRACRHGTYVSPAAYEIGSIAVLEREVFGPVLHVVRFAGGRMEAVCDAINATGYGLTLGIHSRIQSTVDLVTSRVRAGNIYVNRNQIGAVVGVQPFGGEGLSGTGPKAGGPHTLPRFAVERAVTTDLTTSGGNADLLLLGPGDDA